jgi:glycosyltransferase involved in cell wall biosynthesis
MKVLVLQSELGVLRGGGENFTRNLFTAFAERGHLISAAFFSDNRGQYPIPLPATVEPIPIPVWSSANLGQETLASIGRYISNENTRRKWDRVKEALSWRTGRWHRSRFRRKVELKFADRWKEFDVVYVHGNSLLASQVARYRPTVLRLPGPVTAELEPVLRRVQAVCANGDAFAQIRCFLGDHATELPIGVDTDVFKPGITSVRNDLGWNGQHRVIGYVGRLLHLKGTDILAAAFRRISKAVPMVRLLIVGKGPEEDYIRSVLASEISSGFVHLEPDINHSQLAQWYRAMDLLVMPSRYENFSNAVVEAMACGIPFLAADVGGNKIMAKSGSGWVFESGSISALSVSLDKILAMDGELKARGRIGVDYVRRLHNWSSSAERLEQIIKDRLGVR